MSDKKTQKEHYLKIPNHILNLRQIGLCEKVLLAHIYSFGEKGCWQSNATLAEIFFVSSRTVTRWLRNIIRANLVQIKSSKGYFRTIWARSHPDVQKAAQLYYRGKKVPKIDNQIGQKWLSQWDKDGPVSRPKYEFRVRQDCPTTNNTTITETIEYTTATPSPLPAGGQAPALLAERKKEAQTQLERFKRGFGSAGGRKSPVPTEEEFEQLRQKQIKALTAHQKFVGSSEG